MFSRQKDSSATPADGAPGGLTNTYATNGPRGSSPGQGGAVKGFVLTKWLRLHLVDLITMAIMGAIGLGVYRARKWTLQPQLS